MICAPLLRLSSPRNVYDSKRVPLVWYPIKRIITITANTYGNGRALVWKQWMLRSNLANQLQIIAGEIALCPQLNIGKCFPRGQPRDGLQRPDVGMLHGA